MAEKRIIEIGTLSPDGLLGDMPDQRHGTEDGLKEFNGIYARDDNAEGEKQSIYDLLEEEIINSELPDSEKTKKLSRLLKVRGKKVNIMLTGAAGVGKSSTINALFNMEVAKVGVGADPETDCISKFELDNLTLWDTPGLGDGWKVTRELQGIS